MIKCDVQLFRGEKIERKALVKPTASGDLDVILNAAWRISVTMLPRLVLSVLLWVSFANASIADSAFGIEFSGPIPRVEEQKTSDIAWVYPPNPHPNLEKYEIWHLPKQGICRITAYGYLNDDDAYGSASLTVYDKLNRALTEKYGIGENIENLRPDAIWTKERDFVMSVAQSERRHQTVWEPPTDIDENSIRKIVLSIDAAGANMSWVELTYFPMKFEVCESDAQVGESDSL